VRREFPGGRGDLLGQLGAKEVETTDLVVCDAKEGKRPSGLFTRLSAIAGGCSLETEGRFSV